MLGHSSVSSAASVAGSVSSSDWGREYEDEDTWYQFTDAYQSGHDTHLLPTTDTAMSLRMAQYRRAGVRRDGRAGRPSMKQRQQVVDVPARPAEVFGGMSRVRPPLWQLRDIADDEGGDGQGNAPETAMHDGNRVRNVHARNCSDCVNLHAPHVSPSVSEHDFRVAVKDNKHMELNQRVSCDGVINTTLGTGVSDGEQSVHCAVPHLHDNTQHTMDVGDDVGSHDFLPPPSRVSGHDLTQALRETQFKGTVPREIFDEFSCSSGAPTSFYKTRVSTDQFTFMCLERKNSCSDMFQPQVTCVMYLAEDATIHVDNLSPPPDDTDYVAPPAAFMKKSSSTAFLGGSSAAKTTRLRRIASLNLCEAANKADVIPDVNANTTTTGPSPSDSSQRLSKLSLVADDMMVKNLRKFPFFAASRLNKLTTVDDRTSQPRPPVETLAVLLRRAKSPCLGQLNMPWSDRVRYRGVGEITVWCSVSFGVILGALFAVFVKVVQVVVALCL